MFLNVRAHYLKLLKLRSKLRKTNFYPYEFLELLSPMYKQDEMNEMEQVRELETAKFTAEQKMQREKRDFADLVKLEAQNKVIKW